MLNSPRRSNPLEVSRHRVTIVPNHLEEDVGDTLSPRELEIARLASNGLSNKQIALVLEISQHTVSTHLRRTFDKLGLHNRARLAALVSVQLYSRSQSSHSSDCLRSDLGPEGSSFGCATHSNGNPSSRSSSFNSAGCRPSSIASTSSGASSVSRNTRLT